SLEVNLQILNDTRALQIPDLDALFSGGAKPVPVGAEAERMYDRTSIEGVKTLTLSQIPQKNNPIFATTGTERAIRGNSNSIHIPIVSSKGVPQLAVGQVPNLNGAVPRGRNNSGLKGARAETDAAYPIRMRIAVLDCVLTLSQGVPQLDRAVTRGRHDLTVVNGKGHGEHVLGVANEAAGRGASREVPEAELAVPGAGEGELTVG
ncbi:hypothetical protein P7M68_24350, partial [Vibrio parahaemolyticus]|nr:hypothetical protein [Vibrio parahaemolyticus]